MQRLTSHTGVKLRIAGVLVLFIARYCKKTREHSVSENGSLSLPQVKGETPTLLRASGRANVNHWTTRVSITTAI
jgi:hypothetical protein